MPVLPLRYAEISGAVSSILASGAGIGLDQISIGRMPRRRTLSARLRGEREGPGASRREGEVGIDDGTVSVPDGHLTLPIAPAEQRVPSLSPPRAERENRGACQSARAWHTLPRQAVHQPAHEALALPDLVEGDELVGLVPLLHRAGTADDGRDVGCLEEPGFGGIAHLAHGIGARKR